MGLDKWKGEEYTVGMEIDYNAMKQFFHCKNCIEQFLRSPLHEVMTPREYGQYEVGTYDMEGKEIAVVWCKRCGKVVWDSRQLTNS